MGVGIDERSDELNNDDGRELSGQRKTFKYQRCGDLDTGTQPQLAASTIRKRFFTGDRLGKDEVYRALHGKSRQPDSFCVVKPWTSTGGAAMLPLSFRCGG